MKLGIFILPEGQVLTVLIKKKKKKKVALSHSLIILLMEEIWPIETLLLTLEKKNRRTVF